MDDHQLPPNAGLRARKKDATRRSIQDQAMELFLTQGYEATTVEQIAAAAGVSHMTFFRYFRRKEDVVLADDYDALIAALIASRPVAEPAIDAVRNALAEGLARIYAADQATLLVRTRLILSTPALRARLWEQQTDTEAMIARALAERAGPDDDRLRLRVVAATCLAVMTVAIVAWAEQDHGPSLPDHLTRAFGLLQHEINHACA
jgi:AcrR family transcriptional regulator